MVWTIILFLLVLLDQITKIAVREFIDKSDTIVIIDGFFYVINRVNTGAAWSLLSERAWGIYFLSAVSFFASILIFYLINTVRSVKLKIPLTLICAGSIGNLIDRVIFRGVTDFLDFHFGNYIFPTFNIADILIVCGSAILFIVMIHDNKIVDEFPFFRGENQ